MAGITDWENIEIRWRSGVSARNLSKAYGVSHTAINRRAKSEGWIKVSSVADVTGGNMTGNLTDGRTGKAYSEVSTLKENERPLKTKRNNRGGNPHPTPRFETQNRASLKHGGYARRLLTSDANLEDAAALTLEDELLRVRAANLEAAECIGFWKTQMTDADAETQKKLLANIEGAYKAMDRNTSRIESLESNLIQGKRIEAEILLKQATRDRVLFELEQKRKLASLETERRELVNKKIQADIDKADPSSDDKVIVVHNAMQLPGAVQPTKDDDGLVKH